MYFVFVLCMLNNQAVHCLSTWTGQHQTPVTPEIVGSDFVVSCGRVPAFWATRLHGDSKGYPLDRFFMNDVKSKLKLSCFFSHSDWQHFNLICACSKITETNSNCLFFAHHKVVMRRKRHNLDVFYLAVAGCSDQTSLPQAPSSPEGGSLHYEVKRPCGSCDATTDNGQRIPSITVGFPSTVGPMIDDLMIYMYVWVYIYIIYMYRHLVKILVCLVPFFWFNEELLNFSEHSTIVKYRKAVSWYIQKLEVAQNALQIFPATASEPSRIQCGPGQKESY